jgi:hypothetical protein
MIDAEALTLTDPAGTRTTSEAVVRCTYAAALEPMNEMPCHAMHGVRYVRAFAYAALIAAVRAFAHRQRMHACIGRRTQPPGPGRAPSDRPAAAAAGGSRRAAGVGIAGEGRGSRESTYDAS